MSYTALYRKFRPDNFDDVKGQEHITKTLRNQVIQKRNAHAYLFCGTRGTGKTTIAKILARAVNCENPIDGNPCNSCPTCKAIMAATSMNVVEMDAASNNGVDAVREIIDEIQYRPTTGNYKVYIIDEVHMLSKGAFNALLKTLEEPPEYIIFILATTEANKIPITILSRCQRYDFKHISVDVIQARLKELADKESIDVEDKALRYIAKCADGSMRDALSLLDQCQAFSINETLTYDRALDILGAVDTDVFSNMLRAIISENTLSCMEIIEDMVNYGRDLLQFTIDFTWYLRNLLLVKTSENADEIVDMSKEKMEALKEEASMLEMDVIMRYIRILSELSNQMKFATQKRVLLEIAIIKIMQPAMGVDYESLKNRVANIEKKLENGILTVGNPQLINGQNPGQSAGMKKPVENQAPRQLEVAVPEEVQRVADNWYAIVSKVDNGHLKNCLKTARPSVNENGKLCVVYDSEINLAQDDKPEKIELIKNIIAETIGKSVDVELRCLSANETYENTYMSLEVGSAINGFVVEDGDAAGEDDMEDDFF